MKELFKTMLIKLLNLLRWKKTSIWTILGAIIVFSLDRWYIQQDLANLLSIILVALGFGSNYATAKLIK